MTLKREPLLKPRGRPFKPGNPGRPPGARNKATQAIEQLAEGHAESLGEKVMELYRVPEILTLGRFPDARESDSTWRTQEVRHVGSDTIAPRFWCVPAAWFGEEDERRPSGPSASGARRNL